MVKHKKNNLLIFKIILVVLTLIGVALLFNRMNIIQLPNNNLRILTDHFFSGFLIPIWFYILFLGIVSFFCPKRKIEYRKSWFAFSNVPLIFVLIFWEFIIQRFNNPLQIITEVIGLILSWIYFIKFQKNQLKLQNPKP